MLRIAIVLLAMGLLVVALPATAEAHEGWCNFGDMTCWTKCTVHRYADPLNAHSCRWAIGPPP